MPDLGTVGVRAETSNVYLGQCMGNDDTRAKSANRSILRLVVPMGSWFSAISVSPGWPLQALPHMSSFSFSGSLVITAPCGERKLKLQVTGQWVWWQQTASLGLECLQTVGRGPGRTVSLQEGGRWLVNLFQAPPPLGIICHQLVSESWRSWERQGSPWDRWVE
jgi:hypothetical protein